MISFFFNVINHTCFKPLNDKDRKWLSCDSSKRILECGCTFATCIQTYLTAWDIDDMKIIQIQCDQHVLQCKLHTPSLKRSVRLVFWPNLYQLLIKLNVHLSLFDHIISLHLIHPITKSQDSSRSYEDDQPPFKEECLFTYHSIGIQHDFKKKIIFFVFYMRVYPPFIYHFQNTKWTEAIHSSSRP